MSLVSMVNDLAARVRDEFNAARAAGLTVVNAGSDLSAARPATAGVVYWKFSAGVDVGTDGANVVNAVDGDIYYIAGA